MKQIISFMVMSLVSSFAFANGWVGPRPSANNFISGGTSGGGIGPRPTNNIFTVVPSNQHKNIDLVKSMGVVGNGQIKFKYKGFDSSEIQTHSLDLKYIGDKYIEALKKSQDTQNWEPVQVDPQEN